jgi:DNA-directed RNA polymerase specialized sigma24 family protein
MEATTNTYTPVGSLHFDANGKIIIPRPKPVPHKFFTHPAFTLADRVRVYQREPVPHEHSIGRSWTIHMCTPDRADWTTDEAKVLNGLHHAFLSKGIDLETYVDRIIAYLGGAEQSVLDFIATIGSKLEAGSFCPSDSGDRFSKKLSRAWVSYQKRQPQSPTAKKRKRVPPIPAPSGELSAPLKRKPLSERLEESYAGFLKGVVSEDDFLTVSRHFALKRAHRKFRGCDQFGQTPEDITQEAMRGMWRSLHTFNQEKSGFFVWFQRIVDNAVKDAKSGSMKEDMRHAPYFLTNKAGEEFEHPGMYGSIEFKRGGNGEGSEVCYQNPMPQFQRELPEFIQGTDLKICQYIREGYDYEKIGEVLGLSEKAVSRRIARMRKEVQEIKA